VLSVLSVCVCVCVCLVCVCVCVCVWCECVRDACVTKKSVVRVVEFPFREPSSEPPRPLSSCSSPARMELKRIKNGKEVEDDDDLEYSTFFHTLLIYSSYPNSL